MDTEFLRTLDPQILLGAFVALVAVGAGAAYYLSSSKKRRGSILKSQPFDSYLSVFQGPTMRSLVTDYSFSYKVCMKLSKFVSNSIGLEGRSK